MAGTSGGNRRKASAKKAPTKRAAKKSVKRTVAKKSPARKATPQKSVSRASSAKSAARTSRTKEAATPAAATQRTIPESTRLMVAAAADACDEKKAEDTRILELDSSDAGFTDFFLITSGTNERQTQSIADEIEMRLKREFGTYPNSVEGKRQGEWVLLDYVDFVVHIFLAEKRAFYDIERLRKSATLVDLKELQASLTRNASAARPSPRRAAAK
jgi:ribosome silencing factor RsfS/YbeB/iojap